ncbi:DUF6456 domain-containing protein [Azorhizobium doebereinerae]|uniref:DUF6456 domain-containing protein n=1 Tax=Azorhizobium doebereinerae TaxID=281091 RepID=UPI0003FA8BC1
MTQESVRARPEGAVARRRREVRAMVVDGRPQAVLVQADESPLGWLARRKGRDGQPLISPAQFQAGERLRLDFTRASLTPRISSDWSALGSARGGSPGSFSDAVLAAKARVAAAVGAVGPELSGVVLDVCCFLKGLENVEGERGWPARTAKVVLGLGLDRLAAHYGLAGAAVGRGGVASRAWRASDPPPGG